MSSEGLIPRSLASLLLTFASTLALAQDARTEPVTFAGTKELKVIEGSITGDEIVDYVVAAQQSQILSVDLQTSNGANYFNVSPAGSNEAIFIGSTAGQVADVPVPSDGDYVIRVYLMRSAARRNETANYSLAISIGPPDFADGLAGGPDFWEVSGVGDGDSLNLRGGPSTRYAVVGTLDNGDVLQNRGCRLTGDARWCQIRATGSGLTGWVAGRFLVETAPPPAPEVPEGGPVGNGTGFDATGAVPCATAAGQPTRPCPFGVIREGSGNAGIWIALGNGEERHILFERGEPVATNTSDTVIFEKANDLFVVRIGDERYEVPEAVVYGG